LKYYLNFLGLKWISIKCDKYFDLFTLTCFDQAWSSSEGVLFYQYYKSTYLSHLIDLNFKPKYDKCDGPEMNTIELPKYNIDNKRFVVLEACAVLNSL
jgi:hypothetical protein